MLLYTPPFLRKKRLVYLCIQCDLTVNSASFLRSDNRRSSKDTYSQNESSITLATVARPVHATSQHPSWRRIHDCWGNNSWLILPASRTGSRTPSESEGRWFYCSPCDNTLNICPSERKRGSARFAVFPATSVDW